MTMHEYVVTLRHDDGRIRITTMATSADVAVELVCKAELAPHSAVISVKEAPSKDNVRWFRGVSIFPKNVYGMYSAIVDVPGGGESLAADTLEGMRALIRDRLGDKRSH